MFMIFTLRVSFLSSKEQNIADSYRFIAEINNYLLKLVEYVQTDESSVNNLEESGKTWPDSQLYNHYNLSHCFIAMRVLSYHSQKAAWK